MPELTSVQEQALALDKNISVTAGAGSGKTRILVERYLKIVLQNPRNVKRTLAFTFTNKAAGEMQERIARSVNERLDTEQDSRIRRNLLRIRDQLNSASISTIHSFCARTLREFPIEAGLSPDFNEMDEMRQLTLQQEAVHKSFEQINQTEDADEKAQWYYLFSRLNRQTIQDMLIAALGAPWDMELIIEKWAIISEQDYIDRLNEAWLKIVHALIGDIDFQEYIHLIQSILNNNNINHKNDKGNQTKSILTETFAVLSNQISEHEKYTALIKLLECMTTSSGNAYKNAAQLGGQKSWHKKSIELLIELSLLCMGPAQRLQNSDIGFNVFINISQH